jgi:hypothetical protein
MNDNIILHCIMMMNGNFGTIAVEDPAAGPLKPLAMNFCLAAAHTSIKSLKIYNSIVDARSGFTIAF